MHIQVPKPAAKQTNKNINKSRFVGLYSILLENWRSVSTEVGGEGFKLHSSVEEIGLFFFVIHHCKIRT